MTIRGQMRRREFMALVGVGAAAWPFGAHSVTALLRADEVIE